MSTTLIKNALIIDLGSPFNGTKKDILIENGIITRITNSNEIKVEANECIEGDNLCVSIGWMDLRTHLNDPGFEHKEDLETGAKAALNGGFTAIACMGTTNPALHSKSQIEYIVNKSKNLGIHIYPIGTVTTKAEGTELAELYDMSLSGAIAFSDNRNPLGSPDLLERALLYSNGFGKKIIQLPCDKKIAHDGKMNEGVMSTSLGLKGIPAIAEELMLQRDLMIAEHNNTPIHFGGISTAKSVELIRAAKKKGLAVTCDVHAVNLLLDDSVLEGFDSNYKLMPPLRTKQDVSALIAGLKDNTIDVICSDHSPQDSESKVKEFDGAAFGMIGLETFYGVVNNALNNALTTEQLIEKIAVNPRKIFNLPLPKIEEGQKANITVFDASKKWTYEHKSSFSKSKNTPFNGTEFTGKVVKAILTK